MFKKSLLSLIIVSTLLSFSIPSQAKNDEIKVNGKDKKEISKNLKKINDKKPDDLVSQKLSSVDDNSFNSAQENLTINLDLKTKKTKIIRPNKSDVEIGLPISNLYDSVDVVDDKAIYSGTNSKSEIIIEAVDGGIRQFINIKSADAPSFYDFPVTLLPGEVIKINENGSGNILDQNGVSKLIIGKPWAKDANGVELKTTYSVIGSILRQQIDFTNAVFPIVADPIWCGVTTSYVSWINRDGMWSASNHQTGCGAWNCGAMYACWQESYDKTYYCAQFSGNQCVTIPWNKSNNGQNNSMYNQFFCHANTIAGAKYPWNLEPSRADKGYWGFTNFWDKCN